MARQHSACAATVFLAGAATRWRMDGQRTAHPESPGRVEAVRRNPALSGEAARSAHREHAAMSSSATLRILLTAALGLSASPRLPAQAEHGLVGSGLVFGGYRD